MMASMGRHLVLALIVALIASVATVTTACSERSPSSPTAPSPSPSSAPVLTYVHDCLGVIARVNVETGATTLIGNTGIPLTDVAVNAQGALYGLTFDDLYTIDATTAVARRLGAHQIPAANALAFAPDGTLYAAGGFSNQLYRLDNSTGRAVAIVDMGTSSGGDLAFSGSTLYLASLANDLVRVSLSTPSATAVVGRFSLEGVLGLAGTPTGELYAVAGNQVARINPATAATLRVTTFNGAAISAACGQASRSQATGR